MLGGREAATEEIDVAGAWSAGIRGDGSSHSSGTKLTDRVQREGREALAGEGRGLFDLNGPGKQDVLLKKKGEATLSWRGGQL